MHSDTMPPDSTILSGPSAVTRNGATFTFTGNDKATPEFLLLLERALDGAAFAACASPYRIQGLTGSEHQLQVCGLDLAANADPTPAAYTGTGSWRLYLPLAIVNWAWVRGLCHTFTPI